MALKIGTCALRNKPCCSKSAAAGTFDAWRGFVFAGATLGARDARAANNPTARCVRSLSLSRFDRPGMMHTDGKRFVFVTGGTGYIGSRAIAALLRRGHRVRALTRQGSQHKLPSGCEVALGDALDASTFASQIAPADTFLQLVGTPHPGPSKVAEFERVDFVSARESVQAAAAAGSGHFIYLSVAHPVGVMRAYQDVRIRGEALIRDAGLRATMLRPWYVLGPGHWWPIAFLPFYGVAALVPSMRENARRAGLVTIGQMVRTIVAAVEAGPPALEPRILDVPAIRRYDVTRQPSFQPQGTQGTQRKNR
jgi:uncharacterized protein YbjT (DUF2867 family)